VLNDLRRLTNSKSVCCDFETMLVQDFLKLCLIVSRLLAPRIALDGHDFLVWLAFSRIPRFVLLAFVEVVVVVALLVIIVLREAIVLLVLLVRAPYHHVAQFHGNILAVASEVVVGVLRENAVLEAADDVLVGNVGNGGSHLEETLGVGP
jgi:hypothetical protein